MTIINKGNKHEVTLGEPDVRKGQLDKTTCLTERKQKTHRIIRYRSEGRL